ncbi:RNA 2',3'-cyclic phosphodiesterase [Paenibacillus sp. HJGM_3]|uniref:RNA 2',3'-cyclic phosphodiesterase n=1 Tax=Paenibacillus sp. HJGM_3 TaxID=3379816 RepID=UPI00385B62D7
MISSTDSSTLAPWRLFVAVPLPPEVKALVTSALPTLQAGLPFQKWVHPEDVHITLVFLGDTAPAAVPALEAALTRLASRAVPFPLRLEGTGTFGAPQAPRVLWAGLGGSLPALHRLQADAAREAAELGYAPEGRAYAPHVTLARRYAAGGGGRGSARRHALQPEKAGTPVPAFSGDALWPAAAWTADRVVLYRTRMGRSPMYEPLREFVFSSGG